MKISPIQGTISQSELGPLIEIKGKKWREFRRVITTISPSHWFYKWHFFSLHQRRQWRCVTFQIVIVSTIAMSTAYAVYFFLLRYGFVIYLPQHSNLICDVIRSHPNLMRWNALLHCFWVDGQNLRQQKTSDSFSRLMLSTVRFHATSTWAAIVNWTIVEKLLIQGMSKDDAIDSLNFQ